MAWACSIFILLGYIPKYHPMAVADNPSFLHPTRDHRHALPPEKILLLSEEENCGCSTDQSSTFIPKNEGSWNGPPSELCKLKLFAHIRHFLKTCEMTMIIGPVLRKTLELERPMTCAESFSLCNLDTLLQLNQLSQKSCKESVRMQNSKEMATK